MSRNGADAGGQELIPQPHGGALLPGGKPGNKGGTGRPPNELRQRMRELGYVALEETLRRVQVASKEVPPREQLRQMRKAELIDLLEEIRGWIEIEPQALRQILDTAMKYGIGTKHVHTGDDDDGPIRHGIVIMPALERERG